MDQDNRFRRILNRLTEIVGTGALILAASLPIVTGFAALRAGAAVLSDPNDGGGGLLRRFSAAMRPGLRHSVLLGAIFAAATVIGTVDILTSMSGRLGLATVPVDVAGLALLLGAAVLPAWASATSLRSQETAPGRLLRCAVLAAAARPAHSAALLGVVLSGIAASTAAPVLAPAALGALALLAAHLPALTLKPSHP